MHTLRAVADAHCRRAPGAGRRAAHHRPGPAPELPPSEHLRLHGVVALLPDHVTARGHGLLQSLNATLDHIRPGSGLLLRELEPARA